jgi:uncharacterized phage protein (TIGR01671 family)
MKLEDIKFKAKRLDNGEWVSGSLVRSTAGIKERAYIVDSFSSMSDYSIVGVDPSTVCQFTGLKDEDGTEIWEHDILKNHPMTNEVTFRNGSFMIVEDYGDDIVEVPLSNMILGDGVCYLSVISNKFDRKEGGK